MSAKTTAAEQPKGFGAWLTNSGLLTPILALFTAFLVGGLVIWFTSGSLLNVWEAYSGLFRGAFLKQRGFTETLVASIPYVFLSLAVAVGFKSGLFNIGVEGQYTMGSLAAAWAGVAFRGLPALILLPLCIFFGMAAGAIWAAIPGYLKAKTGAHEVINTIMMNYVAFRLTEFLISNPLKDKVSSAVQTAPVSSEAELWTMHSVPQRLENPLNALLVALFFAVIAWVAAREWKARQAKKAGFVANPWFSRLVGLGFGVVCFIGLPLLTRAWWPFTDQYDRLHIGLFLAVAAAFVVWWLLWRTTLGFELRVVGANSNAARYAGVNITRNILLAMIVSGGLAGLAGTVEVLGVSTCRCLPLFFSSGYGFDSIAISLIAKNSPFGILAASFLFGAMRNGADLMELASGVSKYIISLIQALGLLFVAAPSIIRALYRLRGGARADETVQLTKGWGGG